MVSPVRSRMGKALRASATLFVGMTCLAIAGQLLLPNLLVPSTNLAVINARLIPLRSPISGQVIAAPIAEGEALTTHLAVFCIENPQPEKRFLISLENELSSLQARVAGLEEQDARLRDLHQTYHAQAHAYRNAFGNRLDLQIYQARSHASASAHRMRLSELEQKVTERLANLQSASNMDKQQADALNAIAQAEHGLALSKIELFTKEKAALETNIYLGTNDGRPGTPYFVQRLDELAVARIELQARLQENRARVRETDRQLSAERKQMEDICRREVQSPREGILYRKFAQPGQFVKENALLGQAVDPHESFVEAIVGAREFRKIDIGDPARIRLEGATRSHTGKVIRKVGALVRRDADAFAAELISGNKEGDYRVWVAFDQLPADANRDNGYLLGCKVQVRFGDSWLARGLEFDE